MIFLPIVERELRVASRKRSTFWIRIVAALVALVIGIGFLILAMFDTLPFAMTALGKVLFGVLTWLSLAAALSAGLFFTADCLSEEKREGTLGFLFLTDLRGYDVVLGKLLATSMRGFYALFAILPILGITLLMGGVTGAQFWKTSLALVNALFLSLAAGLFVSALSRDSQKAMGATLCLLVLLAAAGPAIDVMLVPRASRPLASASSPVFLFREADAWGRNLFWPALLANQIVAWMLLSVSCLLLPRAWQEKAKASMTHAGWEQRWKFGGIKRRARLRQKLIGVNPILWAGCRERWQAAVLWTMASVMAVGLVALLAIDHDALWFMWSYFGGALSLAFYLGVASQSGRFFVEAQRSGLLELLLSTPLTVQEIVQGQWRAWRRMFGVPLALYLAAALAGDVVAQKIITARMSAAMAAGPISVTASVMTNSPAPMSNTSVVIATTNTVSWMPAGTNAATVFPSGSSPSAVVVVTIASVAGTLTTLGNLAALCWFGMWMGLNSKSTSLATLKTIVFVQIVPWFVVSFASALIVPLVLLPKLMSGGAPSSMSFMVWYPLLTTGVAAVLYLAKDVAFVIWARRKLYSEFRARATESVAPLRWTLPPQIPAAPTSLPATPAT